MNSDQLVNDIKELNIKQQNIENKLRELRIFYITNKEKYDYDYKSNKSRIKLLQFYNTDIADIQYSISPDYGNSTVKPTIKG